jgi:hypothetical protein
MRETECSTHETANSEFGFFDSENHPKIFRCGWPARWFLPFITSLPEVSARQFDSASYSGFSLREPSNPACGAGSEKRT